MGDLIKFKHLRATVCECWMLASNRKVCGFEPDWTEEPTIHALLIETINVEEEFRNQGECRAFLNSILADNSFEMIVISGVSNRILADALCRWGWESDDMVMDFYKFRGDLNGLPHA